MINKKKFGPIAATTNNGKPTANELAANGGMSMGKYKGQAHGYDHARPSRPVVSRYSK